MKMLEISALENGAHRNQTFNGVLPEGWALDSNNLCNAGFPFGEVRAEEINGILTVTKWIPGELPPVEEPEEQPSQLDIIEAQVTYTALMTDTLLGV